MSMVRMKDEQKKVGGDVNHSCPNAIHIVLSFEGLSMSKGKQIQLINYSTCGFEWLEMWVLPNWLWLKSSLLYNH